MAIVSHTQALTHAQVESLREIVEELGFSLVEKPYTIFAAHKPNLSLAVYQKGPKILIQGKGTEDFIHFVLEPRILGVATLGYEDVHNPDEFRPHIGVDESGKGDVFGPLVIAGVFVSGDAPNLLRKLGVTDSKKISSRKKIHDLSQGILETAGVDAEIITLKPSTYNDLYDSFRNLNQLLAWGHAKVIETLFERHPSCPFSLSDQFARAEILQNRLKNRVKNLEIRQQTKAESDVAVAAASILARKAFLDWFAENETRYHDAIPLGAGDKVNAFMRQVVQATSPSELRLIAKTHFKPCQDLL